MDNDYDMPKPGRLRSRNEQISRELTRLSSHGGNRKDFRSQSRAHLW
jgi:hypothetical protein